MEPKRVYFINPLEKAPDGGFIPCIAVEGESGYYKTDWNWGTDIDLAEKIAQEKNALMGYTEKDAMRIILGTMRGTFR
jgi:hypothetical protein